MRTSRSWPATSRRSGISRPALRETGYGVIVLDDDGRAAHATPGAADCLARYFPVTEPLGVLPTPIVAWLAADAATPFVAPGADSKLIMRKPAAHRAAPVAAERGAPGSATERPAAHAARAEVLHWIADGKSNAEIATILGIAAGTVKQHVEHILAKLGVENRTAATALVRERGLNADWDIGHSRPRRVAFLLALAPAAYLYVRHEHGPLPARFGGTRRAPSRPLGRSARRRSRWNGGRRSGTSCSPRPRAGTCRGCICSCRRSSASPRSSSRCR